MVLFWAASFQLRVWDMTKWRVPFSRLVDDLKDLLLC